MHVAVEIVFGGPCTVPDQASHSKWQPQKHGACFFKMPCRFGTGRVVDLCGRLTWWSCAQTKRSWRSRML
jgi:hypothetical protein